MLILSSLEGAREAFSRYCPTRVISILSEDEGAPDFDGLDPNRHLKLYVERESCCATIDASARRRASELIAFVEAWDGSGDLLVHCCRGVSRSTAAAFIIMCLKAPEADERTLAQTLRKAAPYADPCPLLVAYADQALGRGGRMRDAIEDLPPPAAALTAPLLTLPLAA